MSHLTFVLALVSLIFKSALFANGLKQHEQYGCKNIKNDPQNPYKITPSIIRKYGYPVECHFVTTEDGYILEMHRIPHGKNRRADPHKKPVYLQHGLTGSSASFVLLGPNVSWGYPLADQGYDVWIGNVRGNTYSRNHVKLNPNEYKFWDFSFHDIGKYDITAQIDYILNHTGHTQLKYVGHSMGNTAFYTMLSLRPEYNKKIVGQISMCPVAYISFTTSPLMRIAAPFSDIIKRIVDIYFHGEILSRGPVLNTLIKTLFTETPLNWELGRSLIFFVFGANPPENPARFIPDIYSDFPAGISIKTLTHLLQMINSGRFAEYDYGPEQNLLRYHTVVPPEYNISSITTKVAIIYGKNDLITSTLDSAKFYPQLPNPAGLFVAKDPLTAHLDLLKAKSVSTSFGEDVLEILKSFDSKDRSPNLKYLIPVDPKLYLKSLENTLKIGNNLEEKIGHSVNEVANNLGQGIGEAINIGQSNLPATNVFAKPSSKSHLGDNFRKPVSNMSPFSF